jgi:cytidylate kinase
VADALDYTFFGIEIVDWIARSTGLARQLVAGVDERIRNAIDRSVADSFRAERFTESDYLREVVRVVTSLGEQGSAVILGRGSPFILPPERALRALLVGPPEMRAENLAKQRALPLARAREVLAEEDAQRLQFLRHHFGRNPDDPTHYDLVLNLGTLSQDAAERLLIDALAARFPKSVGPKARG